MRTLSLRSSVVLTALACVVAPRDAAACGGTFCDQGPSAMPVDQTGENILFVMEAGFVEAHVQIQYQGEAAQFAWIVPMQRAPVITVGSEQLFANVLAGTVPTYGFQTQPDTCEDNARKGLFANDSFSAGSQGDGGSSGPHVLAQKTVGAFATTTLQGGTAAEVIDWLATNGYQGIDTAPAILQRYIDKNFVFVAVRLTPGAGVNQIHPLTFRYAGDEPCVPLELTAVAAVEDMNVRAFFLGSKRVVPTNYRHVVLNPLKIDWLQFGANYDDLVSRAVDVKEAGGHAFITEYAGPSDVIQRGFGNAAWNAPRFDGATPEQAISELVVQSLAMCDGGQCYFTHPQIEPILDQYLPPPVGTSGNDYWACLGCFGQPDLTRWDPAAFRHALEERVFLPAQHADEVLTQHPYITRLFTRISPYEMTADPMFEGHSKLEEVPLPAPATNHVLCSGASIMEFTNGDRVALGNTNAWPAFDDMPVALRVEDYSTGSDAEPEILADNTGEVRQQIKRHNESYGLGVDKGCGCSIPGRNGATPAGTALLGLAAAGALWMRRRRG